MKDNNKIKVVHIAQANGGIERYLKMFFKYSDKEKYENYLIVSNQYRNSVKIFESMSVNIYFVDMCRELSLIKDIKAMIKIYELVKQIKPNIVYCHSSKAGGLGRIPAKLNKCCVLYNPHGWAFDMNISNKKKMMYKFIEKLLSYITDEIIAISKYEKSVALREKICNGDKIEIIENGIDLDKVKITIDKKKFLKELNWSEENVIIGMVARISEQKSPETFVKVAEQLSKKDDKYRYIIVGDGDKKEEIEDMINNKNLSSKFYLTGWVDNSEEYISMFDIALLTSKWEGFGLVIPEYMLFDKPVIASNVGGISNIIEHGKTGFLVNNLEVEKFCEYITIINNNSDIRDKIISNANLLVHGKYDFKRVVEQHQILYDRLKKVRCVY